MGRTFVGRAYVANEGSNTISDIDTAANPPVLLMDVIVGFGPTEIRVNTTTNRIYITNRVFPPTVSIIDRALPHDEIARLPVGLIPKDVGFSNAEDVVYVSNQELNSFDVTVIGEPPTACTLELRPNYESFTGTLTMEMVIGTSVPATFDLLATIPEGNLKRIASESISDELGSRMLPVTPDTDVSLTEKINKPRGIIGILATLRAPNTGVICSAFETINTG